MKTSLLSAAVFCAAVSIAAAANPAPAQPASAPKFTHLAFVIDTSGSMRDPQSNGLWPAALGMLKETIAAHPGIQFLCVFDGAGRSMLGRAVWMPRTTDSIRQIENAVAAYARDSASNPVPGIFGVLRALAALDPAVKSHLVVIGDELNTSDLAATVMHQFDMLNPADATGQRAVAISVVQLPTTLRYAAGPARNTGLRFHDVMAEVAREHGGTYTLVADLHRP